MSANTVSSVLYVDKNIIFIWVCAASLQEHRFTTMPHKVRCAPAVNSFFANMGQVCAVSYLFTHATI